MDYNPKDYHIGEDSTEEYITSILVDINSRYFVLFGSDGNERTIDAENVEEFMGTLSLIRNVVDNDIVYYSDPLVKIKNAR